MAFCWWILVVIAVIWMFGWFATVVIGAFFNPFNSRSFYNPFYSEEVNPFYSEADRQKNFRKQLLEHCLVSLCLWHGMLPAYLDMLWYLRDIRTGKKPDWIVMNKGEDTFRVWHLSDGTIFSALTSMSSDSSKTANISASIDYDDESLVGEIQYQVQMIAPTPQPPSDWRGMKFTDELDQYEAAIKLERGKYKVAFRVPNRSGEIEEYLAVNTLIVADKEDYN